MAVPGPRQPVYEFDPAQDNIIFDGTCLAEGMVVMLEDPEVRFMMHVARGQFSEHRHVYHSWCTVTRMIVLPDENEVHFIGVFTDGFQKKFMIPLQHAWLARSYSIPTGYHMGPRKG